MRDAGRWLWIGLLMAGLLACMRPEPEQALRDRVDLLQRGIDAGDADAIDALLADDFTGPDDLDRQGARRLAAAMFLRYRSTRARLGPLQLQMHGQSRATVRCTVALAGGSGPLPRDARLYEVTSGWRMDDGQWRVVRAEWTPSL